MTAVTDADRKLARLFCSDPNHPDYEACGPCLERSIMFAEHRTPSAPWEVLDRFLERVPHLKGCAGPGTDCTCGLWTLLVWYDRESPASRGEDNPRSRDWPADVKAAVAVLAEEALSDTHDMDSDRQVQAAIATLQAAGLLEVAR